MNEKKTGLVLKLKLDEIEKAVGLCIGQGLIEPSLVLLYSAIDILGWLDSSEEWASKKSFMAWANKYILIDNSLNCTDIELYGARCGLLHTFSPDSKLSKHGEVRRVAYAFAPAKVEELRRSIEAIEWSDKLVAVHVGDLYERWQIGVERFLEDLNKDQARKSKVYYKVSKFFSVMKPEDVRKLTENIENGKLEDTI
ncbi:MAG: hypothetical protein KQH53_18380 [Desulfarculaceae bacterium]|nr:hypothetical protein [Desulfarculaceae bacterium]